MTSCLCLYARLSSGSITIICLVFGEYLIKAFYLQGSEPVWLTKTIAALCITLVTAINCLHVSLANRVQVAMAKI